MQQTAATEATNAATVVERDPAEPIKDVCAHCCGYMRECHHVCPQCGQDVNVTGDAGLYADDAPVECADDGGFFCESCSTYCHDACGSKETRTCNPCIAWWNKQQVAA